MIWTVIAWLRAARSANESFPCLNSLTRWGSCGACGDFTSLLLKILNQSVSIALDWSPTRFQIRFCLAERSDDIRLGEPLCTALVSKDT